MHSLYTGRMKQNGRMTWKTRCNTCGWEGQRHFNPGGAYDDEARHRREMDLKENPPPKPPEKLVRCNKCKYFGPASEFPKGTDFLSRVYISGCAMKCGNHQSPGDASMRMFGGQDHPFEFVNELGKTAKEILAEENIELSPVDQVMLDAGGAS